VRMNLICGVEGKVVAVVAGGGGSSLLMLLLRQSGIQKLMV